MKKIALMASAVILAAACQKTIVETTVNKPQTEPEETEELVPITFGLNQPKVTLKSVGSLKEWSNSSLYLFAFPVGTTDFSDPTDMIWNNVVIAASGTTAEKLTVRQDSGTEPYYYQGTTIYDFFGYYVDDAAATVTSETEWENVTPATTVPTPVVITEESAASNGTTLTQGLYIPVMIDGSQDIMAATTDKATDGSTGAGASETVSEDLCYSAYSARRNVIPNLLFEHQLARFVFNIKAGAEDGNEVLVSGITLESPTRGYLRVTGNRGIVPASQPAATVLSLMQKNTGSGEMEPLVPTHVTNDFVTGGTNPANQLGESIMVFPGQDSYAMTYTVKMSEDGQEVTEDITLTPGMFKLEDTPVSSFEAGYTYTLTLIIYGLQDIEIKATVDQWKDGGSTEWDPEDAFTQGN